MDKVWGFEVLTCSGDRRKWPEALRAMAVRRIAASEGSREIADEIGANKSQVVVWGGKNAQRKDPMSACFEVLPQVEIKPGRKRRTMIAATDPTPPRAAPSCRIGIPPGYPADHLIEVRRNASG